MFYKSITGDYGRDLPYVKAAFDPNTGAFDLSRVNEPIGNPTFALATVNIPYTTKFTFAGIIAHRIFVGKIQGRTYKFVTGSWDDTVQDSAVIRCYAYEDSNPFTFGQVGLLRIPSHYVSTYGMEPGPPSAPQVSDMIEERWNLDHISRHQRWDIELMFPDGYELAVAGTWQVMPTPLFWSERAAEAEQKMRIADMSGVGDRRKGRGVVNAMG